MADRPLTKAEYSPLSATWSLVFLIGPGLFLPLEQEISRALAERRTQGLGGAPVVRRAATLGVGLALAVLVLPLTVPVLIFGVAASNAAVVGPVPFGTPFGILCALSLMSVVVGPVAAALALRHGLE